MRNSRIQIVIYLYAISRNVIISNLMIDEVLNSEELLLL
jgi:hypothetical protein